MFYRIHFYDKKKSRSGDLVVEGRDQRHAREVFKKKYPKHKILYLTRSI